jgi:hypothetical protein
LTPDLFRLTPDTLESLLIDLNHEGLIRFIVDLYERSGRETERRGDLIITTTPEGSDQRLLIWTDNRNRIERFFSTATTEADVDEIDAVVSRDHDAATAISIAKRADADLIETADLHRRLLYAMSRDECRALCQTHFDRSVEARPVPDDDPEAATLSVLSQPWIALLGVAICGLIVAGVVGVPAVMSDGTPSIPEAGSSVTEPTVDNPVRPVSGGDTVTPTPTDDDTMASYSGAKELEPCPDDEKATAFCTPSRPINVSHRSNIFAGSNTGSLYVTFENPYEFNMVNMSLRIEAPPDWQSQVASGSVFRESTRGLLLADEVIPNESGSIAWIVTPPESASGGRYSVTIVSEWEAPRYDGPERTNKNRFRVHRNVTYRVRPAECRGVEPCSLLANDTIGNEPLDNIGVQPGSASKTTGFLYNPHSSLITNGTVTLEPPTESWKFTMNGTNLKTGVNIGSLVPGESRAVSLNIIAPSLIQCGRICSLDGVITYETKTAGLIRVPFAIKVSPDSRGPYPMNQSVTTNGGHVRD